jgi:hypothetical protein
VRAFRIVDRPGFSISVLPTHLCFGISFHTMTLPSTHIKGAKNVPGRVLRFLHIHFPLCYISIRF